MLEWPTPAFGSVTAPADAAPTNKRRSAPLTQRTPWP
jgi:hypothetical protein